MERHVTDHAGEPPRSEPLYAAPVKHRSGRKQRSAPVIWSGAACAVGRLLADVCIPPVVDNRQLAGHTDVSWPRMSTEDLITSRCGAPLAPREPLSAHQQLIRTSRPVVECSRAPQARASSEMIGGPEAGANSDPGP
jgi:hypothetical protein